MERWERRDLKRTPKMKIHGMSLIHIMNAQRNRAKKGGSK